MSQEILGGFLILRISIVYMHAIFLNFYVNLELLLCLTCVIYRVRAVSLHEQKKTLFNSSGGDSISNFFRRDRYDFE